MIKQLLKVPVENEMDLTLAYKKSIKAAELLGLTLSTQTAFATAVSEVCREVIDKTHNGNASIEVQPDGDRLNLAAVITFIKANGTGSMEEGLQYAKKLIPVFNQTLTENRGSIELKLTIPRSARVNNSKVDAIKAHFEHIEPSTPYEEVRKRNVQLFEINEQSEQALKQAEYINQQKNEFLAIAGHELRNPLTILKGFTQMALLSEMGTETREHLEKVDLQAYKIQMLIQQLLDISRIEETSNYYNKEAVDFNTYLMDMKALVQQLISRHKLEVIPGETATVNIDKLRIEQVIMNIAGNAAKYSSRGTTVTISTQLTGNGFVKVLVTDEGIGMSTDELEKVFDKFYRVQTVSKSVSGLGMGLYISARIVADHGGAIQVESEEGIGSTFSFTLPVAV